MSYQASLQIVITLNQLYLFNLRKQGQVRFKLNLYKRNHNQTLKNNSKDSNNYNKSKKSEQNNQNNNYQINQEIERYCNPYNIARKSQVNLLLKGSNVSNMIGQPNNMTNNQYMTNVGYPTNNNMQNIQNRNINQFNPFRQSMISQNFNNSTNNYSISPIINYQSESSLQIQEQTYYSKIFNTKFSQQTHKIEQSIFFKCFLPVQTLFNNENQLGTISQRQINSKKNNNQKNSQKNNDLLNIKVSIMFSPQNQNAFKVLGSFKGKIRKLSPVSTYLPISFDQFEGFTISATYHTTIMQFKFRQQNQDQSILSFSSNSSNINDKLEKKQIFQSFEHYLQVVTLNFRRQETLNFYLFYRQFLQKQLEQLQIRHFQLIKVLNDQNVNKNINNQIFDNRFAMHMNNNQHQLYKFVKMPVNEQIINLINTISIQNNGFSKMNNFQNFNSTRTQLICLLIQLLLQDFLHLKAIIYEKWNQFVIFLTQHITILTSYYQSIYHSNLKQRYKLNLFSHRIQYNHDWTFSKYQDSGKKYEQMAQNDRKKNKQQELWKELFPIQDFNHFQNQNTFIKMFEEIYQVKKNAYRNCITNKGIKVNYTNKNSIHQSQTLMNNISNNTNNNKNKYSLQMNQIVDYSMGLYNNPNSPLMRSNTNPNPTIKNSYNINNTNILTPNKLSNNNFKFQIDNYFEDNNGQYLQEQIIYQRPTLVNNFSFNQGNINNYNNLRKSSATTQGQVLYIGNQKEKIIQLGNNNLNKHNSGNNNEYKERQINLGLNMNYNHKERINQDNNHHEINKNKNINKIGINIQTQNRNIYTSHNYGQSNVGNNIVKNQKILITDKPIAKHFIILVHGYQASRQDFQVLKLCLQIRFKVKVFISSANQGRTDDNVQAMGKRLAVELAKYFQNIQFARQTKISFIGHSLGGVIIRSALGFLKNINQYLYTYMSFSSPHLGYLYEPSRLVKAGLWFMNSWQGSKCLNQICMKDTDDLRTTYFYRLSENKSLQGFKKIALISSSQDGYIPYESARIQKNSDILYNKLSDSISRNVIIEMVDNILGEVSADQISRINVIFHIQDRNMDSLIGRTAHIKYLSDLKFIKMFFIVFEKFFE